MLFDALETKFKGTSQVASRCVASPYQPRHRNTSSAVCTKAGSRTLCAARRSAHRSLACSSSAWQCGYESARIDIYNDINLGIRPFGATHAVTSVVRQLCGASDTSAVAGASIAKFCRARGVGRRQPGVTPEQCCALNRASVPVPHMQRQGRCGKGPGIPVLPVHPDAAAEAVRL